LPQSKYSIYYKADDLKNNNYISDEAVENESFTDRDCEYVAGVINSTVTEELVTVEFLAERFDKRKKYQFQPIDLSANEWLGVLHFDSFSRLLRLDYPEFEGLEYTSIYDIRDSLRIKPLDRVFIANTTSVVNPITKSSGAHWVVISNIDQQVGYWRIFSSISYPTQTYKELFSDILPDLDAVFIVHENVAKQNDSINCGLFALANALALVQNDNPVLFDWVKIDELTGEDAMRKHFRKCLSNRKIVQFPSKLRRNYRASRPECLNLK
jgi:hypothetical protein